MADEAETNAREQILAELLPGEVVEGVVLGDYSPRLRDCGAMSARSGELLGWDEARPLLETWEIEEPHGTEYGRPFVVWTDRRILLSQGYDGSVSIVAVPRHPERFAPAFIGGG